MVAGLPNVDPEQAVHRTHATTSSGRQSADAPPVPRARVWVKSYLHETASCLREPRGDGRHRSVLWHESSVQTLLDYIEAGDTIDEFLEGFPSVTRQQVIAFFEEAKDRLIETVS
jgi:hypothetical protein